MTQNLFFNKKKKERLQIDRSDFDRHKKCTFSQNRMRLAIDERVDLSSTLEDSVIQLRKEVPQELVVSMFQKLVRLFFFSFFKASLLKKKKQNNKNSFYANFQKIIEFASNPVHACWQADRLGD